MVCKLVDRVRPKWVSRLSHSECARIWSIQRMPYIVHFHKWLWLRASNGCSNGILCDKEWQNDYAQKHKTWSEMLQLCWNSLRWAKMNANSTPETPYLEKCHSNSYFDWQAEPRSRRTKFQCKIKDNIAIKCTHLVLNVLILPVTTSVTANNDWYRVQAILLLCYDLFIKWKYKRATHTRQRTHTHTCTETMRILLYFHGF